MMPLVGAGVPGLRAVVINDLALNTTLYYAADLSYTVLDIGLAGALFGVLTLLVVVALTFLLRKGFGHTPVKVLLPSTLLLYGSTALFMASLAGHVASINRLVAQAQAGLFSDAYTLDLDLDMEEFEGSVLRHSWMITSALGINLFIGDSIVWWRVCAVWRNRVVYCLGPLLILLIFAFGTRGLCGTLQCLDPPHQPQTLFRDGFFADASTVLSLALNVLATALIGYKAWAHRRLLGGHFGCGRRTSRVMKALVLLVESGTIYCLLLIIVVMFQASPATFAAPGVHQSALFSAAGHYTLACFVPVIAIYPVLIVVIVALNWSPLDREHGGLTDGDGAYLAWAEVEVEAGAEAGVEAGADAACQHPPAHPDLGLGLDRAAMRTRAGVVADAILNLRSVQKHKHTDEDGASEEETKTNTVAVVV